MIGRPGYGFIGVRVSVIITPGVKSTIGLFLRMLKLGSKLLFDGAIALSPSIVASPCLLVVKRASRSHKAA